MKILFLIGADNWLRITTEYAINIFIVWFLILTKYTFIYKYSVTRLLCSWRRSLIEDMHHRIFSRVKNQI